MAPGHVGPLAALLLLLLGACQALESRFVAKCSACRAVGEVLTERLEAEVPRNHLDLRHRLDKSGKRYGKLVEYKMSELRVIHLLEDLCDDMVKYELVEGKNETEQTYWALSDSLTAKPEVERAARFLRKEHRKQLENFCHDLLERHEDALSAALRNGEVDIETASDFLCHLTAKHCDEALYVPSAEEEGAGAAPEAQQPEAGTAATTAAGDVKREEL